MFANSLIERISDYKLQREAATHMRRIGKGYFIQTPDRYFPIKPHFLFPLFQFLPEDARVWLIRHFDCSWLGKISDKEKAREAVRLVRLLSVKELQSLFPDGAIAKEQFLGLTKSFIVYKQSF